MSAFHNSARHEPNHRQSSVYDHEFLRTQARWIRDDLDPQIARDGPDALHSDDVLNLDEFLRRLITSNISLEDIRYSRLHLAIRSICGQATRWPKKLIERSDELKDIWERQHGSLKQIVGPLYEPGGRLYGVCKPEDLSKEKLIIRWLKTPEIKLGPMVARKLGNLGFTPGEWWISPLFAFKDGIIDSAETYGGITADAESAYAILMTGNEEINSPSPDRFTYRARNTDRGRYRLTSATRESRQPIRILRSHSLRSFWAPKAGVRYDGLHTVVGWSICTDPHTKEMVYEIKFKRLATELSMDVVLRRPYLDEVEDYKEYKRMRQIYRDKEVATRAKKRATMPMLTVSSDGQVDTDEDATTLINSAYQSPDDDYYGSSPGRDSKFSV